MEFGIQIFGCMDQCKKNPETFFRRIAEAGYKQVEPCILFDDPEEMIENARRDKNQFMEHLAEIIWKPEEVPEYIRLMDNYGLKLSSVHVFAGNLNLAVDKMIETARKNHIKTYVVNCNQQTVAKEYELFADECINLSYILKEQGIELWIHNNGAEIKARVDYNGQKITALSAILDLSKNAKVGVQVDVGWVLYGGIDPVNYLLEVKDYIRSIHFKDLKKDFATREDKDIFACLGEGALNVKDILSCIPLSSEITVLIDQDASDGDIMVDMEKSYEVLQKAAQSIKGGE